MKNAQYITTTIPYVNAPPHVGYACELVQADAIARYHRLCGRQVQFQIGTDENAFKNVLSAESAGIPVQAFVDRNSEGFRTLANTLAISNDQFVRTSTTAHHQAVLAFLAKLQPGDIYEKEWRGLYCAGCEDYYQEHELADGRCPDHAAPLQEIAERNHFFRLSRYQEPIRDAIANGQLQIFPESRKSEILRFIDRGLTDISISRSRERSRGWGIPFPDDPSQVVYVWIDALVNYLTGLGYPESPLLDRYWSDTASRLHVIGKNVWKFHAIYWPALLLSAGESLPSQVFVHGFLTQDGHKISKSSGNAVDPAYYVEQFGREAVRYFLLRHIHPFEDTDFSTERLAQVYDTDLANALGNLCSRVTTLAESAELTRPVTPAVPLAIHGYHEHVQAFRLDLAIETLWAEVRQLNAILSSEQPWVALKAGRRDDACAVLSPVIERLNGVAFWLQPFLPETGKTIIAALAGPKVRRIPALFARRT